MKTVERSFGLAGLVLLAIVAGGLVILLAPQPVASQGVGKDGTPPGHYVKHDVPPGPPWWKHDRPPPGEPCPKEMRPCPPGQFLKYDIMGNNHGNGQQSAMLVQLVMEVEDGSLSTATPVPAEAQQRLYRAVVEGAPAEETELAEALSPAGNEEAWSEAVALVEALQALPYGDEYLPPASEAFNAFLDASSETFLERPAPEFLVVHAFLGRLVEEALSAAGA
jgi:hypothetical protein